MTPYYEHGGITIYHGDCREVLPTLEAGTVDFVFADPPFCVRPWRPSTATRQAMREWRKKAGQ